MTASATALPTATPFEKSVTVAPGSATPSTKACALSRIASCASSPALRRRECQRGCTRGAAPTLEMTVPVMVKTCAVSAPA